MREAYASGGVLYNPEARQVLLQHRSPDAPTNPNQWGLFGRGAEPVDGGDPVATWRRELREELGIVVEAARIRPLGERVRPDGSRRYMFYCEWPSLSMDFVLGEGQGFAWFTFEAALALPNLAEGARYYLPRLRERVLAGWEKPTPGAERWRRRGLAPGGGREPVQDA